MYIHFDSVHQNRPIYQKYEKVLFFKAIWSIILSFSLVQTFVWWSAAKTGTLTMSLQKTQTRLWFCNQTVSISEGEKMDLTENFASCLSLWQTKIGRGGQLGNRDLSYTAHSSTTRFYIYNPDLRSMDHDKLLSIDARQLKTPLG